jgi:iron complex transport system ATP-binding protein
VSILTTKQLSIGYSKNSKTNAVQSGLNLQLKAGELVCLIGPNGSGKSTLLRTMGGLQQALLGQVLLDGHDLSTLTNLEKALRISLVLTERVEVENTTVYQIVALGRHPHNNWWGSLDVNSDSLVRKALKIHI